MGVPGRAQSQFGVRLAYGASDHEPAVALQLLAVDGDRAALAQVADHVPVDRGVVHAPGLGVARAERQVEGAADLLVEQYLLRPGLDPVVSADPELPEAACARVGVERL